MQSPKTLSKETKGRAVDPQNRDEWDEIYREGGNFIEMPMEITLQLFQSGNRKVLDVGCGTGKLTQFIHTLNNNVTGLDWSHEAIKKAHKQHPSLNLRVTDFNTWDPQMDHQWDDVVFALSLHYMKDIRQALTTARTLAKDRCIVMTGCDTTIANNPNVKGYDTLTHQRLCELSEGIFNNAKLIDEFQKEHGWTYAITVLS